MNYKKHYDRLCERAKNRTLDCYVETHHISPRCLGGDNLKNNLVKLTPEEHYVAHQLLVKIHPDHNGLVWAALQMTGQPNEKRNNNKLYGWLRRRSQKIAKQRKGKKNGSYGRHWYHNPDTLDNIKCLPEEVPNGYINGRKTVHRINTQCKTCNKDTGTTYRIYCKTHKPNKPNMPLPGKCKNCRKNYDKKASETGKWSQYCSIKCKDENAKKKINAIEKETWLWYNEFINGNYISLRDFCRKKDINVMTASKRFRKYIKEYGRDGRTGPAARL